MPEKERQLSVSIGVSRLNLIMLRNVCCFQHDVCEYVHTKCTQLFVCMCPTVCKAHQRSVK